MDTYSGEAAFPTKPRTAEDLRRMWPGTALEAFGLILVEAGEGRLILEMPIGPAVRQPMGLLHGGVHLFVAESAASLHACMGVDLCRIHPVGIETSGSHLGAAREGSVRAVAEVVGRSRTKIVHQVTISHVETGRRLCVCRVTNLYRRVVSDGESHDSG